ncbi:hypothetical protein [Bradyrhizobium sp.]|jgi:hypothetical protein|uniref:hypothetical protein n=1 Tax=Bradyrhizobium sp. TaxID=376 RepID=UPI003C4A9BF3
MSDAAHKKIRPAATNMGAPNATIPTPPTKPPLLGVVNRYVGNLAPMPGVFPDYPAPVIRRRVWLLVRRRTTRLALAF